MGRRLKIARTTLRMIRGERIREIRGIREIGGIFKTKLARVARARLEAGPAKDIIAESRLGFCKLKGSNCTGFPQPKRTRKSIRVPSGSRWARGFRVRRPWMRGVGSPRRLAA